MCPSPNSPRFIEFVEARNTLPKDVGGAISLSCHLSNPRHVGSICEVFPQRYLIQDEVRQKNLEPCLERVFCIVRVYYCHILFPNIRRDVADRGDQITFAVYDKDFGTSGSH